MIWWEQRGAERSQAYRFSLYRWLSHTIHPVFLCADITPALSTLSLPPYPLLFFPSPVCNHNNPSLRHSGNKPGPPFFLCTSPLARTKPIKGWLNYSCWLPQTPVYNTVGLTVGWVWAKCDGMLGVGKNCCRYIGASLWLLQLNPQDATL